MAELPIATSAAYAALLALLIVALAARVSYLRARLHRALGHGTDATLERAVRAHGNAVENVPLALLLMLLAELGGAGPLLLHGAGLTLLASRGLHVWAINQQFRSNATRAFAALATWAVMALLALDLLAQRL